MTEKKISPYNFPCFELLTLLFIDKKHYPSGASEASLLIHEQRAVPPLLAYYKKNYPLNTTWFFIGGAMLKFSRKKERLRKASRS